MPLPSVAPLAQDPTSRPHIQLLEELTKHSLTRFHRRLLKLERREIKQVRVLHWGDSHVASDVLTGALRSALQARFGDRGPGFVLLGRPWRSYRHEAARYGVKGRWRAERLYGRYSRRRPRPRDDHFGVAGVSVHTTPSQVAHAWLQARRGTLAQAEIYYLQQPHGGSMQILVDGRLLRHVRTAGRKTRVKVLRLALPAKARRVELQSKGDGEVRLYGADLRRRNPGILYDVLGINGARADMQLAWGEATVAMMLRHLSPDLLVFAYGSNEVDATSIQTHKLTSNLRQVLARARRAHPAADCVVVGPPDQARRVNLRQSLRSGLTKEREGAHWRIPQRLTHIVNAYRSAARGSGCAFWDQRAAMGGLGSIFAWRDMEPPLARADHVHFYVRGYQRLAEAFHGALMASYRTFRLRRVLAQTQSGRSAL
ncbi:MAG: hypothetical protein JRH20_14660 [Deltaproteobacteria bacterium]|nr:hypothetical protein [Deltaproteobacteria bacterium]